MNDDKIRSLYIDCARWNDPVKPDDFLVAIGKKQSNSVYHVAEVKSKPRAHSRIIRYYLKVFKTDLMTALQRDSSQNLITIFWYSRNKKSTN